MSELQRVFEKLDEISKDVGVVNTSVAVLHESMTNLKSNVEADSKTIEELGGKIQEVDEKHDTRALGLVATVLLGILAFLGNLFIKAKVW